MEIHKTKAECPLLNPAELWSMIKTNCTKFSKQYARQKARQQRDLIDNL